MLQLDGAKFSSETVKLTYSLPEPFGPDRGEAKLSIIAKPATGMNLEYKKEAEKLLSAAKLRDLVRRKRRDRTGDDKAYLEEDSEDALRIGRDFMALKYDHCIVQWETDIQSDGKAIEPTKENFIALSEFPHPDVARVFRQMNDDLGDLGKWQAEAAAEIEAEETGNSRSS